MTKNWHTPWKIRSGLSDYSASIEIEDSRRKWVASVQGDHRVCRYCNGSPVSPGFPTDEEAEAIARLIIGMPDVLEAAQELLHWSQVCYAETIGVEEAVKKLQEAISRATEEKS